MRRPGGTLYWQWGAAFAFHACHFSWACAGGRRHVYGSFPVRAVRPPAGGSSGAPDPPHILAAPPLSAAAIVPTLYDPEEFATLYHADKDRAIALIAAMTEPQRVCQALAYAAWLAYHGLEIDLDTVLAAWESS